MRDVACEEYNTSGCQAAISNSLLLEGVPC